jgi:hypothetical protein
MSAAPEFSSSFVSSGATSERAPGSIGGPGAWRGSELAQQPLDWTYFLSSLEVSELNDAMRFPRD